MTHVAGQPADPHTPPELQKRYSNVLGQLSECGYVSEHNFVLRGLPDCPTGREQMWLVAVLSSSRTSGLPIKQPFREHVVSRRLRDELGPEISSR